MIRNGRGASECLALSQPRFRPACAPLRACQPSSQLLNHPADLIDPAHRERFVMRKPEYNPQNNVVPFRQKAGSQPAASAVKLSKPRRASAKTPTPEKTRLALLAMSQKGSPTPELIDELAPRTIRRIIDFVGPNAESKTKLSRRLRRRLDLMCRFKHPAGLMLRDWLDGNRRFLPANFQTIADYSCSSEETE